MSDKKEITTGESRELSQSTSQGIDASQRLALIKEALINPDVAPEKAAAMMELTFKLEDRQARADFIRAKVAAISEMPHIGKDGMNDHTQNRYSTWERMQPTITPVLARHGLVLNFDISQQDGRVAVAPILSGWGWEERGGSIVLPADTSGSKNNVQAVGSSVKYGQRYAAVAMLNLISRGIIEDDDGVAGGGTGGAEDRLTPDQRALVDKGREMAMEGSESYLAWFKGLAAAEKGWLAYEPYHGQNKECAAKLD